MGQLAGELAVDRTTLTANLKPLERRKLIKVVQDDEDARVRRVLVTDEGKSLIAKVIPVWKHMNDKITARLRAIEPSALRTVLDELIEA